MKGFSVSNPEAGSRKLWDNAILPGLAEQTNTELEEEPHVRLKLSVWVLDWKLVFTLLSSLRPAPD